MSKGQDLEDAWMESDSEMWMDDEIDDGQAESSSKEEYVSPFFTSALQLPVLRHCCKNCTKPQSKSACGSCRLVYYCCHECQKAHWPQHRKKCKDACQARQAYSREEQAIRHYESMDSEPINYFEDPGYKLEFNGLLETRSFLAALTQLVRCLLSLGTAAALKEAILLQLKLLYHCRGDDQAMRDLPLHFLRLGMDQEAYDLIKWFTEYPALCNNSYDFYDASLPYLHFWQCDRSEPVLYSKCIILQHVLADLLIKQRLQRALQDQANLFILLKAVFASPEQLAMQAGVVQHIDEYLIGSALRHTHARYPEELEEAITHLLQLGDQESPFLWRAMLNPEPLTQGEENDAAVELLFVLEHAMTAWHDSPGAMGLLYNHCMDMHGSIEYEV